MSYLVIHLAAKNDSNGNPKRCYVVLDASDGTIREVIDEGYHGSAAWRRKYPDAVEGPRFDLEPKEYTYLVKHHPATSGRAKS